MTEENGKQTSASVTKELLAAVAGFSAISYILGFLIINASLISRGAALCIPPNAKYLAAGLCYMFLYVLVGIIFAILPRHASPADEWIQTIINCKKSLNDALQRASASGSAEYNAAYKTGFGFSYPIFFYIGYGVGYLLRMIKQQLGHYTAFLLLSLFLFYITSSRLTLTVSCNLFAWTIFVTLGASLGIDLWNKGVTSIPFIVPPLLILTVIAAIFYGCRVYPYLSPSIGGGMPTNAAFVIAKDNLPLAEALLATEGTNTIKWPVQILMETSDYFIILQEQHKTSRVFLIKKELVSGVAYWPVKTRE